MRPGLCAAALLAVVALGAACKPRAVPNDDANADGWTGPGTSGRGGQGGGAGLGGAGAGGPTGDAGSGGSGGPAGHAGSGGAGGTTGGAGGTTGGAGGTTGGAGAGGSAGGAAGTGGVTPGTPDCPPGTATGLPCDAVGPACSRNVCHACSDRHWRLAREGYCSCAAGSWMCTPPVPIGPIGDCFFDPPLDCALAQLLYEDASCQMHPPCSAGN